MQEAVVPMSTSDSQAVSESDRKFLEASVGALQSYKNDLEMAINYLAGHETDASAAMMADCLKTTDALNTTMTVYREVGPCLRDGSLCVSLHDLKGMSTVCPSCKCHDRFSLCCVLLPRAVWMRQVLACSLSTMVQSSQSLLLQ